MPYDDNGNSDALSSLIGFWFYRQQSLF